MHVYIISKENTHHEMREVNTLNKYHMLKAVMIQILQKIRCLTQDNILWLISQIETKTWSEFYPCLSKTLHM